MRRIIIRIPNLVDSAAEIEEVREVHGLGVEGLELVYICCLQVFFPGPKNASLLSSLPRLVEKRPDDMTNERQLRGRGTNRAHRMVCGLVTLLQTVFLVVILRLNAIRPVSAQGSEAKKSCEERTFILIGAMQGSNNISLDELLYHMVCVHANEG